MAGALQRAVARLTLAGGHLTLAGGHLTLRSGLFVPAQSRCVCVLDADSELTVRQACDVAGLGTATVQPVTPLLAETSAPVLPGRPEATASGRTAGAASGLARPVTPD